MSPSNELPRSVQTSWHRFLESVDALRPDLYRYCRHLTRSSWDAEDLAQDTMARAFVTLGQLGDEPPNPRAWLFRVASNLWIDQVRRRQREERLVTNIADTTAAIHPPNLQGAREAAGTLIGRLAPRERAAVVLKDALDFSLEETAEALSTTVGAVKAALHRGREKLVETPDEPDAPSLSDVAQPSPTAASREVLDAPCGKLRVMRLGLYGYGASILLCAALGCGSKPVDAPPAAPPAHVPQIPHAKLFQCPSHSLGASIGLSDDGHYGGHARDNYQDTQFTSCEYSARELRCDGRWSFSEAPSVLVITAAPDGKLSGHLTLAYGSVAVLECVVPDHDLGHCVFNPGTSTCKEPPWDMRH